MRTTAKIVKYRSGHHVMVECSNGLSDWPIMYSDGTIAYDHPEAVPQFIRPRVARLLREAQKLNKEEQDGAQS